MTGLLLATFVAVSVQAAPVTAGSDERVRFVNEGSGCDNTKTLFLDSQTGRELFCQGLEYSGPLSEEQQDAVVALAVQLAEKDGLSGADKDRVEKYARNPKTRRVVGRTYGPLAVNEDAAWIAGEVRTDAPAGSDIDGVAVLIKDPAAKQRAVRLPGVSFAIDLATSPERLWVLEGGAGRLIELDTTTCRRARRDRKLQGIGDLTIEASSNGTLWILDGTPAAPDSGVNTTPSRLERLAASGEIEEVWRPPEDVGLSGPQVGEGAVWVMTSSEGAATVYRFDEASGQLTATIPLTFDPIGWAVGEGAVWFLTATANPTSEDAHAVIRADPKTLAPTATIALTERTAPGRGGASAITAGGGAVWLLAGTGSQEDLSVIRVDPATNTATETIDVPTGRRSRFEAPGIVRTEAIAAADSGVWITDRWGQLFHIDPATKRARVVKLKFDFGLRR
jgi:hypothetical protein